MTSDKEQMRGGKTVYEVFINKNSSLDFKT